MRVLSRKPKSYPIQVYTYLLKHLAEDQLQSAYKSIEDNIEQLNQYVKTWLSYQALWDMQASFVYERLGDDINLWQQLLSEIKLSRTTFDTSDTSRAFGPVTIDYRQVQAKVNNKYDAWHKELLSQFGNRLGSAIGEFHGAVTDARTKLERYIVDFSTTEAVAFLTQLQEFKTKEADWDIKVDSFQNGQRLLEKQRFQFPSDWLHFEQVASDWSAFQEILRRKNEEVAVEIPMLRKKIIEEDETLEKRVEEVMAEWAKNKPLRGDVPAPPPDALATLAVYERRAGELQKSLVELAAAKQALHLNLALNNP